MDHLCGGPNWRNDAGDITGFVDRREGEDIKWTKVR
jgi:hypothetical protein